MSGQVSDGSSFSDFQRQLDLATQELINPQVPESYQQKYARFSQALVSYAKATPVKIEHVSSAVEEDLADEGSGSWGYDSEGSIASSDGLSQPYELAQTKIKYISDCLRASHRALSEGLYLQVAAFVYTLREFPATPVFTLLTGFEKFFHHVNGLLYNEYKIQQGLLDPLLKVLNDWSLSDEWNETEKLQLSLQRTMLQAQALAFEELTNCFYGLLYSEYKIQQGLLDPLLKVLNDWSLSRDWNEREKLQLSLQSTMLQAQAFAFEGLMNRIGGKYSEPSKRSDNPLAQSLEYQREIGMWDKKVHSHFKALGLRNPVFQKEFIKAYGLLKQDWARAAIDELFILEGDRRDRERYVETFSTLLRCTVAVRIESSVEARAEFSEGPAGAGTGAGAAAGTDAVGIFEPPAQSYRSGLSYHLPESLDETVILSADEYLEGEIINKISELMKHQQYLVSESNLSVLKAFMESLRRNLNFQFSRQFDDRVMNVFLTSNLASYQPARVLNAVFEDRESRSFNIFGKIQDHLLGSLKTFMGPNQIKHLDCISSEDKEKLCQSYAFAVLQKALEKFREKEAVLNFALALLKRFNEEGGALFQQCPVHYHHSAFLPAGTFLHPLQARLLMVSQKLESPVRSSEFWIFYSEAATWLSGVSGYGYLGPYLTEESVKDYASVLRFLSECVSFPSIAARQCEKSDALLPGSVSSDQVRDSAYRTLLGGRGAAKRDYPGMLAYFESRMIREASQGQFGFLPVYLHLYHSEAIHAYGLPERLVSGQGSYSSFQPNLQNLFIQVLSADLGSKEAMFRQLQIFERLLEELCALTAKRVSRGAHPDFYHLPNYVVPALHAAQCTLNTFRNAAQNPLELAHYAEVSERDRGASESKSEDAEPVALFQPPMLDIHVKIFKHWVDLIFLQTSEKARQKSLDQLIKFLPKIPREIRSIFMSQLIDDARLTHKDLEFMLLNIQTPSGMLTSATFVERAPFFEDAENFIPVEGESQFTVKAELSDFRQVLVEKILEKLKSFYLDAEDFLKNGVFPLCKMLVEGRADLLRLSGYDARIQDWQLLHVSLLHFALNQSNVSGYVEKLLPIYRSCGLNFEHLIDELHGLGPQARYPLALFYLTSDHQATAVSVSNPGDCWGLRDLFSLITFVIADLQNNAEKLFEILVTADLPNHPNLMEALTVLRRFDVPQEQKSMYFAAALCEAYFTGQMLVKFKESDKKYQELNTWLSGAFNTEEALQRFNQGRLGKDFKARKKTFHILLDVVRFILFSGASQSVYQYSAPADSASYSRHLGRPTLLSSATQKDSALKEWLKLLGPLDISFCTKLLNDKSGSPAPLDDRTVRTRTFLFKTFLAVSDQMEPSSLNALAEIFESWMLIPKRVRLRDDLPLLWQRMAGACALKALTKPSEFNSAGKFCDVKKVSEVYFWLESLSIEDLAMWRKRFWELFLDDKGGSETKKLREKLSRKKTFAGFFELMGNHILDAQWDLYHLKSFADELTTRAKIFNKIWSALCARSLEALNVEPDPLDEEKWTQALNSFFVLGNLLTYVTPSETSSLRKILPSLVDDRPLELPRDFNPLGVLDHFHEEALRLREDKREDKREDQKDSRQREKDLVEIFHTSVRRFSDSDRVKFFDEMAGFAIAERKYAGLLFLGIRWPELLESFRRKFSKDTFVSESGVSAEGDSPTQKRMNLSEFLSRMRDTADQKADQKADLGDLGALLVLSGWFDVCGRESDTTVAAFEGVRGFADTTAGVAVAVAGAGAAAGAGAGTVTAANAYEQFFATHNDLTLLPGAFLQHKHQKSGLFSPHGTFNKILNALGKQQSVYSQWMVLIPLVIQQSKKMDRMLKGVKGSRGQVMFNVLYGTTMAASSERASQAQQALLMQVLLSMGAYLNFVPSEHLHRQEQAHCFRQIPEIKSPTHAHAPVTSSSLLDADGFVAGRGAASHPAYDAL